MIFYGFVKDIIFKYWMAKPLSPRTLKTNDNAMNNVAFFCYDLFPLEGLSPVLDSSLIWTQFYSLSASSRSDFFYIAYLIC